ncbi:TPA: YadA-like family protein, partial [Salmonella enterica subsp. enterica serovar Typhimurium]|nr:YadA-like family protein [Salmonella enterica subsp. enterica serovar Typhimurium]
TAKADAISSANAYTDAAKADAISSANEQVATEKQARINGDAVTLKSANSYTDSQISLVEKNSRQYTDSKFNQLNKQINRAEKRLNAGIAGVTAISSIPYVAENSFSYGIGVGNYQNGNAIAAGIQYKTSLNTNVRLNVSWDSSHNTVLGAGFAGGW